MTGMLVSGSTIQVWLDWERVPQDICNSIADKRAGDIVMFSPRTAEMSEYFDYWVRNVYADVMMPHPTRAGTIFVKRSTQIEKTT